MQVKNDGMNKRYSLGSEHSKQSEASKPEGLEPSGSSQVSSSSVAAVVQHPYPRSASGANLGLGWWEERIGFLPSVLGDTAYHLAIARAPGGLEWLYWLVLHAAQGHGPCIKCIMKSNMDMRPQEEIRTGSGDVLALLAHRIPRHSHSALANQEGNTKGLYDGVIECFGMAGRTRCCIR